MKEWHHLLTVMASHILTILGHPPIPQRNTPTLALLRLLDHLTRMATMATIAAVEVALEMGTLEDVEATTETTSPAITTSLATMTPTTTSLNLLPWVRRRSGR